MGTGRDRLEKQALSYPGKPASNPVSPSVIIVDDEEDLAWVLARVAEKAGWTVHRANSGAAALRLLEPPRPTPPDSEPPGFEPSLAFVDLMLPDFDGWELVRRLRSLRPDLRFVVVSGLLDADAPRVRRAVKSGEVAGFLAKPFPLDDFRDWLELGRRVVLPSSGP